jgi:phage tail-like protein
VRAIVPDLESPHPLGFTLPAIYQEDDLAQRFCSALDEVLAPVFNTLDCFDAYLDPMTTPEDFLDWLASWVGLALDENWPVGRRRQLIDQAGEMFSRRGTAEGLKATIKLYVDADVEVTDSGGTVWSPAPGSAPPGQPEARVTVRVRPARGGVDERRIANLVASVIPAHVVADVEVVAT